MTKRIAPCRAYLLPFVCYILLVCTNIICAANNESAITIHPGEALVLNCTVPSVDGTENDTSSDIIWLLNNAVVPDGTQRHVTNTTSQLVLSSLEHDLHRSNVSCLVGTVLLETNLVVVHNGGDSSEVALKVGTTLVLNCTLHPTAATISDFMWYHGSEAVPSSKTTLIDGSILQLTIPNVTLEDSGNYSCISRDDQSVLKKYNVVIGLFPQLPDEFECSGHNYVDFTCDWSPIPDTGLPTDYTFEYSQHHPIHWQDCPSLVGNSCKFNNLGGAYEFRFNVSNALGSVSMRPPQFSVTTDTIPYPPSDVSMVAPSGSMLSVSWGIPFGMLELFASYLQYELNLTSSFDQTFQMIKTPRRTKDIPQLKYANSEYCVTVRDQFYGAIWSEWSRPVCATTLPTAPNSVIVMNKHLETDNAMNSSQRDITFDWMVIQPNDLVYQGISGFHFEVMSNRTPSYTLKYTYNLTEDFQKELVERNFSLTIPGLSKYENYTVSMNAVNSAGSTSPILVKVNAHARPIITRNLVAIIAVAVILTICFLIAMLGFAFQRLKNKSKPIPDPKYHCEKLRNIYRNVRPSLREPEVFDEIPPAKKEMHAKMVALKEEEMKKSEKISLSPSRSSSGLGSDLSAGGDVEKAPLIQKRTESESSDKGHYARLSTIRPEMPNLTLAPDAIDEDIDMLLSPTSTQYSEVDEGISVGGTSSYYHQSGSDSDYTVPYHRLTSEGLSPVSPTNASVSWHKAPQHAGLSNYTSDYVKQDVGIVCGGSGSSGSLKYLRSGSEDADDECSLPPSPMMPGDNYQPVTPPSNHRGHTTALSTLANNDPYVTSPPMLPVQPQQKANKPPLAKQGQSIDSYLPNTMTVSQMVSTNSLPNINSLSLPGSGYVDNTMIGNGMNNPTLVSPCTVVPIGPTQPATQYIQSRSMTPPMIRSRMPLPRWNALDSRLETSQPNSVSGGYVANSPAPQRNAAVSGYVSAEHLPEVMVAANHQTEKAASTVPTPVVGSSVSGGYVANPPTPQRNAAISGYVSAEYLPEAMVAPNRQTENAASTAPTPVVESGHPPQKTVTLAPAALAASSPSRAGASPEKPLSMQSGYIDASAVLQVSPAHHARGGIVRGDSPKRNSPPTRSDQNNNGYTSNTELTKSFGTDSQSALSPSMTGYVQNNVSVPSQQKVSPSRDLGYVDANQAHIPPQRVAEPSETLQCLTTCGVDDYTASPTMTSNHKTNKTSHSETRTESTPNYTARNKMPDSIPQNRTDECVPSSLAMEPGRLPNSVMSSSSGSVTDVL